MDRRYACDVVGDLTTGPLTPLSTSLGPARHVADGWAAALRAAGALTDSPVVLRSGHLWLDPSPPEQVRDPAAPDSGSSARVAARAAVLREERPDLSRLPEPELRKRLAELDSTQHAAVRLLCSAEFATLVSTEAVLRIAGPAGRSRVDVLAAIKPDAPRHGPRMLEVLWELGRAVAGNAQLTALFDRGPAGLANRIAASRVDPVRGAYQAFGTLTTEWGHHGPEPWELEADTWGTAPVELLAVLDLLPPPRGGVTGGPASRERRRSAGPRGSCLCRTRSRRTRGTRSRARPRPGMDVGPG